MATHPNSYYQPINGGLSQQQIDNLALQQQYTQQSGGYIINPDGSIGPRPPSQTSAPNLTPTTSTLIPNETPEEKALRDAETNAYQATQTQTTAPNEQEIMAQQTARFQSEIDALDRLFATKRSELNAMYGEKAERRVGSQSALLASAGMLGQVSGEAQRSDLDTANMNESNAAINLVDDELRVAKNNIFSKIREEVSKDLIAKRDAYTKGADATVEYLKGKAERKNSKISIAVKNALLNNIDLSTDNEYLKSLAKETGIDVSEFINAYKEAKIIYDNEQKKAQQAQAKLDLETRKTLAEIGKDEVSIQQSLAAIAKTKAQTSKLYSDAVANKNDGTTKFLKDIQSYQDKLQSGKADWAMAYNYMVTTYGSEQGDIIDKLLNKDVWSVAGAYQDKVNGTKVQAGTTTVNADGSITIH